MPFLPVSVVGEEPSSSRGLMPFGRAGQGKTEEADTVNTAPMNVRKKRDDNAERRVGDERRN